jgi:hypothetical protein
MDTTFEKHYRVRELAAAWGFCDNTIIRLFANEPGVIRLERGTGGRKYVTLSIPESVARRVHETLSQQPVVSTVKRLAVRTEAEPRRVIRLRVWRRRNTSPDPAAD